MKSTFYLPIAALACAVLTGCSVKESTISQPEPVSELISQIRTEQRSGDVAITTFFYDEQQRVKQQITTLVDTDTQVSSSVREFVYGNGRIDIGTDNGEPLTLLLDEEGYARELVSGDRTLASYHYNANGYYYEPEQTEGRWSDYQYLLAGDRCNLAMIKKYGPGQSSVVPKLLLTTIFEYGDLANDANLNLSYLIAQESHGDNTFPMLYGWGGKRDSDLPKMRRTEDSARGSRIPLHLRDGRRGPHHPHHRERRHRSDDQHLHDLLQIAAAGRKTSSARAEHLFAQGGDAEVVRRAPNPGMGMSGKFFRFSENRIFRNRVRTEMLRKRVSATCRTPSDRQNGAVSPFAPHIPAGQRA